MDRELPKEVIHKKRVLRLGIIGAALTVILAAFWGLRALLSPSVERARILTSVAEMGDIEATVTATGIVVPAYEQILTAPVASTVEAVHVRSGDSAHAGQSILQLNTGQLQLAFRKVSDELEIQKNKKEQVLLDLEREQADLRAAYDIKELNRQFAASKFERAKHLFDIGGITRVDFDLASLNLEIARRESEQLAEQVGRQEATLAATRRELDLQISVYENQRDELQRQLSLAEVCPGRDGILTWVNDQIGAPVTAGEVIARVGDLSSFEVEATISDIHVGKLTLGGAVNVRIREHDLRGRIASIRPEVQNGVVTFIVELDNKSDPALHPNLRADVYVVTSTVGNVIRVKNGPFYNGSVDQPIFVVSGDEAVRRTVDIGVSNFDWVELKGDVQTGEEIIVSDTRQYRHQSRVSIR